MSSAELPVDELVRKLPLPLAQLFRRATNAATPLERHNAAYFFWEAGLKLLSSVTVVEYADIGAPLGEKAPWLENLARPAVGHWWEFLRELTPVLADAGKPAFVKQRTWLLGSPRPDMQHTVALSNELRRVLEKKDVAPATSVKLADLFAQLAQYRNREIGHGATGLRGDAYYDRMGSLLLTGVAELWHRVDPLAGGDLVFVSEVRRMANGNWQVNRFSMSGENRRRLEPIEISEGDVARCPRPKRVYLSMPGESHDRLLHPLVYFDDEVEQCYFMNARPKQLRVQLLCYANGDHVPNESLYLADHEQLLGRLLKGQVNRETADEWAAKAQADEPSAGQQAAARIGDFELLSEIGAGSMGTVYRAWQPLLGRQVALKCLKHAANAKSCERFQREIRALGAVEHPHLAKIFTSGSDGLDWFFAMDLIHGANLARICERLAQSTEPEVAEPQWRAAVSNIYAESAKDERVLSTVGDRRSRGGSSIGGLSGSTATGRGLPGGGSSAAGQSAASGSAMGGSAMGGSVAGGSAAGNGSNGNATAALPAATVSVGGSSAGLSADSAPTKGPGTATVGPGTSSAAGTTPDGSTATGSSSGVVIKTDPHFLSDTPLAATIGAGHIRQAVEIMRQTAEAAHALHEAGVVHRDIKPGNILVRPETLDAVLMDLGLAQIAGDEGEALTETKQFVGTVRYASPEQVLSARRVDRRSDVYSLGATLWELLTLRPLFGATPQMASFELMLKVQSTSPQHPRELNAEIPADLEAIVMKCLEKERDRRYATAAELAADLNRFLKGEPVSAQPPTLGYLLRKALRRHRRGLAGVAALLVLAALGVAAAFYKIDSARRVAEVARSDAEAAQAALKEKNTELTGLNHKLDDANAGLTALNAQLKSTAEELEKSRDLAQKNSEMALGTLSTLVQDVQRELAGVPTAHEVRRKILLAALPNLEELGSRMSSDRRVDQGMAVAHTALGDLMSEVGDEEGLSGTNRAEAQYEAATAAYRRLAKAHPDDLDVQRDLTYALIRQGRISVKLGKFEPAKQYFQQGIDHTQNLIETQGKNPLLTRDLLVSWNELGDVLSSLNQTEGANDYYQKALKLTQELAEADPTSSEAQRDLDVSFGKLGNISLQEGHAEEAMQYYRRGLEIAERLAEANPTPQTRRDLAYSLSVIGTVTLQLGKIDEALEYHTKALEIRRELWKNNSRSIETNRELALTLNSLGFVALKQEKPTEAGEYFHQAMQVRERLATADPANVELQSALAESFANLGRVCVVLENFETAIQFYEKELEIRQALVTAAPEDPDALRNVSVSYNKLGHLKEDHGHPDEALELYLKDLAISEQLSKLKPADRQARRDLFLSCLDLGNTLRKLSKPETAFEHYQRALQIAREMNNDQPDNAQTFRDLASVFDRLAEASIEMKKLPQAMEYDRRLLELRQQIAKDNPTNPQAGRDLRLVLGKMGDLSLQMLNHQQAIDYYQRDLDLNQEELDAHPENSQAERDLTVALEKLGGVCMQLGKPRQALPYYEKDLAISEKLAEASPTNAEAQRDLAVSYYKMGGVSERKYEYDPAIAHFQKSLTLLEKMVSEKQMRADAGEINVCTKALARSKLFAAALADATSIPNQPVEIQGFLWGMRGLGLAASGQTETALAAVDEALAAQGRDASDDYRAAQTYCLCALALGADPKQLKPTELAERNALLAKALAALGTAASTGFENVPLLSHDEDLAPVRETPEFRKLLTQMKTKPAKPAPKAPPAGA